MREYEDIVELSENGNCPHFVRSRGSRDAKGAAPPASKFLSVWYRCCHTYGRLYRNREQTAYTGRCPRCGAQVRALIGPDGTTRRMFEAR